MKQNMTVKKKEGKIIYTYPCQAKAVFGLGERYCSVNHKGKKLVNKVFEQFTRQEEHTYFPLPFYHCSDGHGVFIDTLCEVTFSFEEKVNRIEIAEDAPHTIHFYEGTTEEIIRNFIEDTGKPVLPPKWAFGVWASANRWNAQKDVEEQLRLIEEHNYPVSVIVIEAWSDEATFYIWNGASYQPCKGEERLSLKDFTFAQPWPDPIQMIDTIHEKGMKLVLWQIPALKELEAGRYVEQHSIDCSYAQEKELLVKGENGVAYQIPKQWFIGATIPDFSNPETIDWWANKREYLLKEMKVDGFKTDGGEFIHDTQNTFYAGYDGRQGRNSYPALYEQAYFGMLKKEGVLFSRAGYIGSQMSPMHWAGDQVSTFEELKSVLNAGLSLSLSGVPFWSFDIGGFAGPLPNKELYLRSTAFAAFVPAMQWHSEPADGQFEDILKGNGGTNDRSPWNMAAVYQDNDIMETAKFFANLHMNLLPFFYQEAIKSVEEQRPFMRHLTLDYGNDEMAILCEDEYMIGDLLVAPVTKEHVKGRNVYLPEGIWYDFWDGRSIQGGCSIEAEAELNRIPLFVREGASILINLADIGLIGSFVEGDGRECKKYLLCAGEKSFNATDLKNEKAIKIRIGELLVCG